MSHPRVKACSFQIDPRSELTIHQLYDCLQGFKGLYPGIARRAAMTFKCNRSERQMQVLKSRVRTHHASLQLALQMITVYLICSELEHQSLTVLQEYMHPVTAGDIRRFEPEDRATGRLDHPI